MYGSSAPGVPPRAGGVPVSGSELYDRNRATSLIAGADAGIRAGTGGVSIGRFAWVGADGIAYNARSSPQQQQGIVVTQDGDWRRVFWDELTRVWKIREGLDMTMLSAAPGMWVEFEGVRPNWNQRVYADPVDGRLVAAYAPGLESSAWSVAIPVGPGGLSLISTWNKPNE